MKDLHQWIQGQLEADRNKQREAMKIDMERLQTDFSNQIAGLKTELQASNDERDKAVKLHNDMSLLYNDMLLRFNDISSRYNDMSFLGNVMDLLKDATLGLADADDDTDTLRVKVGARFDLDHCLADFMLDARAQELVNDRVAKFFVACAPPKGAHDAIKNVHNVFDEQKANSAIDSLCRTSDAASTAILSALVSPSTSIQISDTMSSTTLSSAPSVAMSSSSTTVSVNSAPSSTASAASSRRKHTPKPISASERNLHERNLHECSCVQPVALHLFVAVQYGLELPLASGKAVLVSATDAANSSSTELPRKVHVYDKDGAEAASALTPYVEVGVDRVTEATALKWRGLVPNLVWNLSTTDVHRRTDAATLMSCADCDLRDVRKRGIVDKHALCFMATSLEAKALLDRKHLHDAVSELARDYWSILCAPGGSLKSNRVPVRIFVVTDAKFWTFVRIRLVALGKNSKPFISCEFATKVYKFGGLVPCAAVAPTAETPPDVLHDEREHRCETVLRECEQQSQMFSTSLLPRHQSVTASRTEHCGDVSADTAELLSALVAVNRFNMARPSVGVRSLSGEDAPPLLSRTLRGVKCAVLEILSKGTRSIVARIAIDGVLCVVKCHTNPLDDTSADYERSIFRELVNAGVPHLPAEVTTTVLAPLRRALVLRDDGARSLNKCCLLGDEFAGRILELLFANIKVALVAMHGDAKEAKAKRYAFVDLHIGNIIAVPGNGAGLCGVAELQLVDFESALEIGTDRTPTGSPVLRLAGEEAMITDKFDAEFDKRRFVAVVNWVRQRGRVDFRLCAAPRDNNWWDVNPGLA
jgi:hypothetical protein